MVKKEGAFVGPAAKLPLENRIDRKKCSTSIASGSQCCRNLHWDEEVASQDIGVQVAEGRRRMELLYGHPSVRFAPLPARGRKAFNRFLDLINLSDNARLNV